MARSRRRLGLVFYVTALVALAVLLTIPFWQTAIEQTSAWRLSRRLGSPDETVRRAAADGLVQLGPAASPWVIRAMSDPDARVRVVACSLVVRSAPEAGMIPLAALEAVVADADPSVRVAAVGQLDALISRYGSPDNSSVRDRALRTLCGALQDESPQVRAAAGWALFNVGPNAKAAVSALDQALNGADKSLRVIAAEVLFRIDPAASRPRVADAMGALIADQTIGVNHWRVLHILVRAQGEDATVAMLVPLFANRDRGTSMQAINDLITHCATPRPSDPN